VGTGDWGLVRLEVLGCFVLKHREAVGLQCSRGFTGWFRFHTGSRVFRFEALVCFIHEHTGKSEAVGLQCPCGFTFQKWAGTIYACIWMKGWWSRARLLWRPVGRWGKGPGHEPGDYKETVWTETEFAPSAGQMSGTGCIRLMLGRQGLGVSRRRMRRMRDAAYAASCTGCSSVIPGRS